SSNCKNVAKTNNDIFQLTVPTGGGKTLSSLRFALHHAKVNKMDRIIYVVPFNTIIDQNAQEVRDILEIDEEFGTIVLEHHSNLTEDEETPTTKLLSENWDAPIIFTSMVQFLDTLFAGGTRSVRRMHQLANSIIIFDEIQTLGVKFIYLFNIAIQFLKEICHSSIVLCTATQPLLDRVDPKSYALNIHSKNIIIKDTNNLYKEFSRTSVEDLTKYGGWDDDEISEFALKKVKGGAKRFNNC
ncbi:MAG TPA: DEAD/DEAH box helicase, partial [Defluviitaleaceae bacterium]|nr:DEAD/DEAH box helicase [Defluviitaleaceae bacterium]